MVLWRRQIIDGAKEVSIFGEPIPGASSHLHDQRFLRPCGPGRAVGLAKANRCDADFLVHKEEETMRSSRHFWATRESNCLSRIRCSNCNQKSRQHDQAPPQRQTRSGCASHRSPRCDSVRVPRAAIYIVSAVPLLGDLLCSHILCSHILCSHSRMTRGDIRYQIAFA